MLHQKVSQFNNPQNLKGESLRKTEASSSKHLMSNRSRIAVSHRSQNQHLLSQCYSIISAQQAHINKLEKDNERKDKIMAQILNKGDLRKINNECTKNTISTKQIEKISEQLQNLYRNYDKLLHENEVLRTQLMEKDKYVLKINQQIGEAREREVDLKKQLQDCKESVVKLKVAYENKINKLLGEFRNNIQKDIENSKTKNLQFFHQKHSESQTKYLNQPNQYAEYQQTGLSPVRKLTQSNSKRKIFTPIKGQKQNLSFENSQQQTRRTKNWMIGMQQKSNNIDTEIKKLINTPYRKPNSDFIYSSSKAFPTASTKISQFQSTDLRKGRNTKMLENVKDAQFSVEYYQSSQSSLAEQQSESSDITEEQSNQKASKNMNKISVQQIVRKFSEYYNKYECQNGVNRERTAEQKQQEQLKKQEMRNERERGDKQFSRIKWNNMLEEIRRRIKKFESSHQQNMQF